MKFEIYITGERSWRNLGKKYTK